jgi:16S rRNA (guanine527-N7)-methyltransferase
VKEKLRMYLDEIIKFDGKAPLIPLKSLQTADAAHFADSIIAARLILKAAPGLDKIYDIGTGAGFPGLVFAILYPKIHVVLVDTNESKCEFLVKMAHMLKLSNVTVERKGLEELPHESIRYAMTRGYSTIARVILFGRRAVVKGGAIFHLKGEEWGAEVADIPIQLCSIWSPALVAEYKLPVGSIRYAVLKTEKISSER